MIGMQERERLSHNKGIGNNRSYYCGPDKGGELDQGVQCMLRNISPLSQRAPTYAKTSKMTCNTLLINGDRLVSICHLTKEVDC